MDLSCLTDVSSEYSNGRKMETYEKKGVRLEEVRRRSGSVCVVYNEKNRVVVITCDRGVAQTFMKPKERK